LFIEDASLQDIASLFFNYRKVFAELFSKSDPPEAVFTASLALF